MRIAIAKETAPGETRVALIPDGVKKLKAKGWEVYVQAGAGEGASISDADYVAAGAVIEASPKTLWGSTDLVMQIRPPTREQVGQLREGATLISMLNALVEAELVQALAARKVTALAAELIPRTTLAQMMDVLSSQATVAGYRAVLLAAEALPKFFPMLMTAAGTIPPATVLILGAGVAGLQAIATARRLGAVVEAFDVRKVVKEQVESLGAKFVEVPSEEDAQTASGYAKELSEEYKKKQADLLKQRLAKCDACITTALIPGQKAPVLVTADMVKGMKRGAVLVDLGAEQGGNCELTKPGKRVVVEGVNLIGDLNLPSQMAVHASQMYSRNMEKLLLHLYKKDAALDATDEITKGMTVTRDGAVVHERVQEALKRSAPSLALVRDPAAVNQ
jgi:NAD(P) transhydrogenase subunit alpha